MVTLIDHGTFVPKNPVAHGEEQEHLPYGHHTLSADPSLRSLENAPNSPSLQPGGRGMPPDGPHIPTGFAFEPDDGEEPPYSRAFDDEQDGGHITYPPVDADLDAEITRDLDGSLTNEQLLPGTIHPFQQPADDRLPQVWKEVER